MNGLLFSLPGTPVLYYGDEIGMGDNFYLGDRNGVRTPMQWSADRNAGFSRANPQRLCLPVIIDPEYHYEAVNVEAQQNNPQSLLWWTKRLISFRKRTQAFGRGTLEFLPSENRKVLSFVRRLPRANAVLVVANLSRFAQHVELDLSAFRGLVPVELFGHTPFPAGGRSVRIPWRWARTPSTGSRWRPRRRRRPLVESAATAPCPLSGPGRWLGSGGPRSGKAGLEAVLPDYLPTRRWFGGQGRSRRSRSSEALPLPPERARRPTSPSCTSPIATESQRPTPCRSPGHRRARPGSGGQRHRHRALAVGASDQGLLYDGSGTRSSARPCSGSRPGVGGSTPPAARSPRPRPPPSGSSWPRQAMASTGRAAGRAEQHVRRVRRPVRPEALPAPRGGSESRSRDRAAS